MLRGASTFLPFVLAMPLAAQVRFDVSPISSRYNRVQGYSLAGRLVVPINGSADAVDRGFYLTPRIGFADLDPEVEARYETATGPRVYGLGAYRRLAAANPAEWPLDLFASLHAFAGWDYGLYYRATGIELTTVAKGASFLDVVTDTVRPGSRDPVVVSFEWSGRLFAEAQRNARAETMLSIAHLVDRDHAFDSNLSAASAEQFGGQLMASLQWTGLPALTALRLHGWLDGETGTFSLAHAAACVQLRSTWATIGAVDVAAWIDVTGGSSIGDVPPQSLFSIGGPGTLRGQDGVVASGTAFWRTQAVALFEVASLRAGVFADHGWAGPREDWARRGPTHSFGITIPISPTVRLDFAWAPTIYAAGWPSTRAGQNRTFTYAPTSCDRPALS